MGKRGDDFSDTQQTSASRRGGHEMSTNLYRITQRARECSKARFTALAHHLTEEFLVETWRKLNKRGAAGIDRVSASEYAQNLDDNIRELVKKQKERRYRAPNVRRVLIQKLGQPKKLRPLGIPTLEDRLLQAAVARILSSVYEADFLDCSYGFRPGRNAHQAIARLRSGIMTQPYKWIYEADIRGFFDHLDHEWLMRMLELRIGDSWILRLIKKWLKAGILVDGQVERPTEGTPQGGPLSPTLANVYLHYALDLWFTKAVIPKCIGKAEMIRFADDFVVMFEHYEDAEQFGKALGNRLEKFHLTVAEEKTRILPFGRSAWRQCHKEHFDFLGFRHHLGTTKKGRMAVIRLPSPKSITKFLTRVKEWLAKHRHERYNTQQKSLAAMIRGFNQYFGLHFCTRKISQIIREVYKYWRNTLRKQSQRSKQSWDNWSRKPWFRLPGAKLIHPEV